MTGSKTRRICERTSLVEGGSEGVRRALMVFVLATFVLLSSFASAQQSRTAFLIDRLKSDDFKVRTNAALALGATNEDAAVQPLCGAVNDPSEVVRQAVALALKRLARASSLACLRARVPQEGVEAVKLQMTRAIESIEAATGGATPPPPPPATPPTVANAKFYVALSNVANNSGRAQAEVDAAVLGTIRSKLDAAGNIQRAPSNEAPEAVRATLKSRKLKGYYLAIAVDRFDYSDGNLKVRVKVAVFTYPGKDLRGNIDKLLTVRAQPGDKSSEDNLMQMAAGLASDQFAQNAALFD